MKTELPPPVRAALKDVSAHRAESVEIRQVIREEVAELHEAHDEQRVRFDRIEDMLKRVESRVRSNEAILGAIVATLEEVPKRGSVAPLAMSEPKRPYARVSSIVPAPPAKRRSTERLPAVKGPLKDKDIEKGAEFITQVANPQGSYWARVTPVLPLTKRNPRTGESLYYVIRVDTKRALNTFRLASELFPVHEGFTDPGQTAEGDEEGAGVESGPAPALRPHRGKPSIVPGRRDGT